MTTKLKIKENAVLPAGVKLAKKAVKVRESYSEYYPITKMPLGSVLYVPFKTARDMRGVIHTSPRKQKMKFVSRTVKNKKTATYGVNVYRIR